MYMLKEKKCQSIEFTTVYGQKEEYNSNAAIVQVLGVAGAGHRGAGHRDQGVDDNNITNMLGVVLVAKAKILKYIYI